VKCSKFEVNTNPMKNVADMKVNFYIPSQALAFINLVRKSKSFFFFFFQIYLIRDLNCGTSVSTIFNTNLQYMFTNTAITRLMGIEYRS
jgi:hypothetical protein